MGNAESALYLYGFIRACDARVLQAGSSAAAQGTPFAVEAGGLAAVVERVAMAEFGPDVLQQNLEDLSWISRQARRHQEVLAMVAREAPVVPVKLGTVFLDDRRMIELARAHERELGSFLNEVQGKEEWGIRVFVQDPALEALCDRQSPELAAWAERIARADPGEGYLLRKRRDQLRREEARSRAAELAEAIAAEIEAQVEAAVEAPLSEALPSPGAADPPSQALSMILHLAVLVQRSASDLLKERLDAMAEAHREAGVLVVVSGPWPPYHFCPPLGVPDPPAATEATA